MVAPALPDNKRATSPSRAFDLDQKEIPGEVGPVPGELIGQSLPRAAELGGQVPEFRQPVLHGNRLAPVIDVQRRLVRETLQKIRIDIDKSHAWMVGHEMSAANLAVLAIGVFGLVEGGYIGFAPGDPH